MFMDRALGYHLVRVTENAAIESAPWRGKGDKKAADGAATTAMRETLNALPISAKVVIGEGEIDEAPMLYIGEELGTGGEKLDIAVDPLDGTTLTAKYRENAIAVIAIAETGSLLHAPDMYMMKIGVGPKAKGAIDLSKPFLENLKNITDALGKKPGEVNIVMLDRDRHNEYVKIAREFGMRVTLITDGDVCPMIGAGLDTVDMDILFGIGGAPEGVLAAAAARCLGGDFQGKLWPENEAELERCKKMGIKDPKNHIFRLEELVKSENVIFSLTGVTNGYLTKGVDYRNGKILTQSLLLDAREKAVRFVDGIHSR
jgi:fructose-1,6-bisphosphatase II